MNTELEKNNEEEDYVAVPMFDDFEDNGEFSPLLNDLFGVVG